MLYGFDRRTPIAVLTSHPRTPDASRASTHRPVRCADVDGVISLARPDGIASRVELPSETKQALLEQRSEPERMRMLGNALQALVAAVNRSSEIAERAKMNGKVIVR